MVEMGIDLCLAAASVVFMKICRPFIGQNGGLRALAVSGFAAAMFGGSVTALAIFMIGSIGGLESTRAVPGIAGLAVAVLLATLCRGAVLTEILRRYCLAELKRINDRIRDLDDLVKSGRISAEEIVDYGSERRRLNNLCDHFYSLLYDVPSDADLLIREVCITRTHAKITTDSRSVFD